MANLLANGIADLSFLFELCFDFLFVFAISTGLLQWIRKAIFYMFHKNMPGATGLTSSILVLSFSAYITIMLPLSKLNQLFIPFIFSGSTEVHLPILPIYPFVCISWVFVCVFLLMRHILQQIHLRRTIRFSAVKTDPALQVACAQYTGLKHPTLVEVKSLSSPGLYGWRKPVITMPENFYNLYTKEQRVLLYLHELAHLQRGDFLFYTFLNLIKCVFWLHLPLIKEINTIRQHCEMQTDKTALAHTSVPPLQYAKLLVGTLGKVNQIPASFFNDNYKAIQGRLQNILLPAKPSLIPKILVSCTFILLTIGFVITPREQPSQIFVRIQYTNQQVEDISLPLSSDGSTEVAIQNYLDTLPQPIQSTIKQVVVGKSTFYWEGFFGAYVTTKAIPYYQ